MSAPRRLSQALSEGDGISLIARVGTDADAARAEEEGAEAVLVNAARQDVLDAVRAATSLPILFYWERDHDDQLVGADACVVDARGENEREWLHEIHGRIGDSHEIALRIEDEEHLEDALEEFDSEIFILAAPDANGEEALERVLDLLPDVPAGKLAIAELRTTERDEVDALERAGVDGVIVEASRVAALAGDEPPDV
jgi:NAD(P)H-dependent flavin oxidoreductase YrpB (nitropropane dioxygenase family)